MAQGNWRSPTTELNDDEIASGARETWRWLVVVQGVGSRPLRRIVLGPSLVIGRDCEDPSGLSLSDGHASREHARIELDPASGLTYIKDCGSLNGTFVDGRRIERMAL